MEVVLFIIILFTVFGWSVFGMYVLPFATAAMAYIISITLNESLCERFSKKIKIIVIFSLVFFIFALILSLRFPKEFSDMFICKDFFPFLKVTFY